MTKEDIRGIVAVKLSEVCKSIDPEEVNENFRLKEDLSLDSIDKTYLFFYLETEFDVTFKDREIETCVTVGDVVTLISTKIMVE